MELELTRRRRQSLLRGRLWVKLDPAAMSAPMSSSPRAGHLAGIARLSRTCHLGDCRYSPNGIYRILPHQGQLGPFNALGSIPVLSYVNTQRTTSIALMLRAHPASIPKRVSGASRAPGWRACLDGYHERHAEPERSTAYS